MKLDRRARWIGAAVGAGAALLPLLWLALTAALVGAELGPERRALVADALQPHLGLIATTLAVLVAAVLALLQPLLRRWLDAPARLHESARALLASDSAPEVDAAAGGKDLRGIAAALNQLAQRNRELRDDVQHRVAEAARDLAEERNRLAALMSELTQSVVVCNLDGRILLYNARALQQFEGAGLIGLGRSIYAVFDRALLAHALDSVQQRLKRGDADPSTQFVTATAAARLLRVQMAPVREAGGDALGGYVLLLHDITRDDEQQQARERLLLALTEGSRGSLANLQAAVEMLEFPDLDDAARERFVGVIRDEARTMSRRLDELAAQSAREVATRWPLEPVLGAELLRAAGQRIEARGGLQVDSASEVDAALWLRVDSFALLQALTWLALRLRDEYGLRRVQLRLAAASPTRAHLDLAWSGGPISTETAMTWELDPMQLGDTPTPLTLRDVVQRHGGEFWFERDRARGRALLRLLLPLAPEADPDAAPAPRRDSRPEFYDFELFAQRDSAHPLDQRRLAELACTVFDTETTGLDPAGGDEILQIGATRIVNGRLLRGECYEQLVDPRRAIPPASIPIHGITPEMVAGQPTIDAVLPAFRDYANDSVLVAHNAAFDLRFLQLKEAATGVRFEQPVLDTLLLSALVHPNQESHRLEDIAARLGVAVTGRHTALGDALVTAEVFLKLLPLLEQQGLRTLGEVRAAAQKTYYARIRY